MAVTKRLAFIDDDRIHANLYVQALKLAGFEVSYFESVRSFLDTDESPATSGFDAIISDLMMPSGNSFSPEQTQEGLFTGLALALDLRGRGVQIPIVILTNLNVDSRYNEVETQAKALIDVFVTRKFEQRPDKLAKVIQGLLETGKLSKAQVGVIRQFFDSLILKPTIFGLGIDLKELAKIKWR